MIRSYYTPLPLTLTAKESLICQLDVIIRDIGYLPIGALVGFPRIIVGIFQAAIASDTCDIYYDELHPSKITYQGSKLAADGCTNVIRGLIECIPLINSSALPLWDNLCQDRYFLYPNNRPRLELNDERV